MSDDAPSLLRRSTWKRGWRAIRAPGWLERDRKDVEHIRLLVSSCLAGGGLGVDVGANVGHILRHMVAVSDARHLAFEPVPSLAADLARRFGPVDVRSVALGELATSTVEFEVYPDNLAYSGLPGRTHPPLSAVPETIQVPMSTLDRELDGRVPSLIKIDVEGAEHAVLSGGLDTIGQHRPLVIFEHGHNDRTPAIFDMLLSINMTVFDIDGDGPYSRQRWLEAVERGDVWNFFAC